MSDKIILSLTEINEALDLRYDQLLEEIKEKQIEIYEIQQIIKANDKAIAKIIKANDRKSKANDCKSKANKQKQNSETLL